MAEPVRRGMEMKIVRDSQWKPAVLGGNMHGSIHEDILALGGRETEVTWEDVYPGTYIKNEILCDNSKEELLTSVSRR